MRGTSFTKSSYGSGDVLSATSVNETTEIVTSADDDMLAELLAFEPPAGVTSTTPYVGFLPLRDGIVAYGDAAARQVHVNPIRVFRSSISNSAPRQMVSGITETVTTVPLPAAVSGAGNWRLELLYAQLAYVDSNDPTKGTTVTLDFAPTGAGSSPAPTVATLPANTSSTWNVPLFYVKNVNGATTIANEDIIEVPPTTSGGFIVDNQRRIRSKKIGIDARRAYSSANNDPTKLVSGGASDFASGAQILTSTVTPMMAGRQNGEIAFRPIYLPKEVTGPNAGATKRIVVDNTRDWRGANFLSIWIVNAGNTIHHAEDDDSAGSRIMPTMLGGSGTGVYISTGQSWNALDPANGGAFSGGSALWASVIGSDVTCPPLNIGGSSFAGDVMALEVDASTGVLYFTRKRAGAAANGPAITIYMWADFGNHRPL